MHESEKANFAARLQAMLQAWSDSPDDKSLEQFLSESVGEGRASVIIETLAGINDAHEEVRSARELGRTRSAWLGDVLKEELPGDAWADFLESPIKQVMDLSKGMPASAVAASLAEIGNGALLVVDNMYASSLGPKVSVFQEAVDFFQSPLGSASETPMKAVASAVAIDFLDESESQVEAPAITAAIDVGLETAKVGYKVATGEKSLSEGVEHLQDRIVAAAASVIRRVAPKVGEQVGHVVGHLLGGVIGMAPFGAMVGRVVGRMAGEYVAEHAETGVKAVAKAVKSVTKNVARAAKSVWSAAKSFVGGLFGA